MTLTEFLLARLSEDYADAMSGWRWALDRKSGRGIDYYRCRVCRSNFADTRTLRSGRTAT